MVVTARAEDGHDLWLRYRPLAASQQQELRRVLTGVAVAAPQSPLLQSALSELDLALPVMSGRPLRRLQRIEAGSLVLGLSTDPVVASLGLPMSSVGEEGYLLRSVRIKGSPVTLIAANTDRGLLYGSFALLAQIQQGKALVALDQTSAPRIQLRMLDHWDNLDGHVERGYAGASLWDWWKLPDVPDPLYREYARANASIGINSAVLEQCQRGGRHPASVISGEGARAGR